MHYLLVYVTCVWGAGFFAWLNKHSATSVVCSIFVAVISLEELHLKACDMLKVGLPIRDRRQRDTRQFFVAPCLFYFAV